MIFLKKMRKDIIQKSGTIHLQLETINMDLFSDTVWNNKVFMRDLNIEKINIG
jgi:hypothetical protein